MSTIWNILLQIPRISIFYIPVNSAMYKFYKVVSPTRIGIRPVKIMLETFQ